MQNALAVLVRLRRWRLDEERRRLVERLAEADLRRTELAAVEAAIAGERAAAAGSAVADVGLAFAAYAARATRHRAAAAQALSDAEAAAAVQRGVVIEAHRELRTVTLAEEAQAQRAQREAARAERLVLDETALALHTRR